MRGPLWESQTLLSDKNHLVYQGALIHTRYTCPRVARGRFCAGLGVVWHSALTIKVKLGSIITCFCVHQIRVHRIAENSWWDAMLYCVLPTDHGNVPWCRLVSQWRRVLAKSNEWWASVQYSKYGMRTAIVFDRLPLPVDWGVGREVVCSSSKKVLTP